MNATPTSLRDETRNRAATSNADSRILIVTNNPEHAPWITRGLAKSVFAALPVDVITFKDDFDRIGSPSPALVVLDIEEIAADPLHYLKQIRQFAPEAGVLTISRIRNADLASRLLRAGSSAYLTDVEADELLPAALEHVAAGERFVSEEVMQGILHGMVETGMGENRLPIEMLSDREMVVFQLIGQGRTFREVADELGVNIKTVATHCNNIRRKLHSRDNRHLTRISRTWVAEHHPDHDTDGHRAGTFR
ncbi:MAG TPA: response regulator transcription factor [Kiritimatiellia bacterium]|nr:response regulator transcription factor [Kiritimatiellia bacterium]HMO99978.1 response regulator transcription factor [Kiritimatiellia bacterium]HMP96921.1 response regulator transcription factor [Kiritimatiellia bacterium]